MPVIGTSGHDVIDGSADPDEIHGLEGDDSLYGHGGDDLLYGGDGDDMLAGGAGDDLLDGGAGDDTLWGGSGADTFVFRDGYGHDVIMDFDITEDRVNLTSGGVETWADVQDRLGADTDGTALLTLDDGSTLRFEGLSLDDLNEDHFILPPSPVCFAAGTRIATPHGNVLVELLRAGDLVLTLDHGPQPLLWVGRQQTVFGHGNHRHQPVRIAAGAMGSGLPEADLLVSPQHRLLVVGPQAKRFAAGGLAKAKGLCGQPGISPETACTSVEYLQLLLPRHAIVLANGLPAESFLPRGFALSSLLPADRATICALIPGLIDDPRTAYGPPARPLLSMQQLATLPRAALESPAPVAKVRAA
ncbi:MAG: Hint domain-containing protein [Rubellimicrobium sp.]|nr:Hint domain-containing protein [Rubellimicrobium sp.]